MVKQNVKNMIMVHLVVIAFILFVEVTPTHFTFLMWNVFLAILPLDFALMVLVTPTKVLRAVFSTLWLLFFPNTMYMITDFIHLQYISDGLDVRFQYFNYSVLATGIFIGVFLGALSLDIIMYHYLPKQKDAAILITLAVVSLVSSFGIYLGRFLRLNSWDVFTNLQMVWDYMKASASTHMAAFVIFFAGAQFAILVVYHFGGRLLANLAIERPEQ
ncbi:DUF1361 domain-containing protein [Fructobacillus ficulneus]|uniref:Predicted membrane protein n=1 Tax=Fructobacillus ficulneus TaxID=157463 RepID=A0A0K8MJ24_9LACO|nr:DUF1361 domain-containing protein [Fructobacillus ficulneus]GAP00567.1 predicted membrane protein [Fructobacillus ficulneus]